MFNMRPGFATLFVILFATKMKVSQQTSCRYSPPGFPGNNGVPGNNGAAGRDGRDGAKGDKGERGQQGQQGTGTKGEKGSPGLPGRETLNWKQCAWNQLNDDKDINLIRDCVFVKKQDSTALRVVYQDTFHIATCRGCCKRWFITFNGAECSGPLPIDAVLFTPSGSESLHIPGSIEGYCENIHKGKIRVGINIGNCEGHYKNANGYRTKWKSVSRLVIEEVPQSAMN